MREIKFRAWDKKRNVMMIHSGNYTPGDNFEDYHENKDVWDEWWGNVYQLALEGIGDLSHNESIVLMQYTGLKDKNGKEIYEGDIIKYHYSDKPLLVRFGNGAEGEPADYMGSYVGWCLGDEEYAEFHNTGFFGGNNIEVIGNIYENPDLLEKDV